jgi:hypothetical protein
VPTAQMHINSSYMAGRQAIKSSHASIDPRWLAVVLRASSVCSRISVHFQVWM